MSYFQSLQGFRAASDQIQQHQLDIQQEFNDKKAQTIEEKFDHVKGLLDEAGSSIGGFGGGFHLTRKIYKKVKGVTDKAKEAMNKKPATEEPPVAEDPSATQANGAEGTRAPTGEVNQPPEVAEDLRVPGATGGADADVVNAPEGLSKVVDPTVDDLAADAPKPTGAGGMIDSAVDEAGNITSKVVDTAGEVLDFLGPVGELLGAGLAIGSLFRDVFEHKKIEREKDAAESGQGIHPLIAPSPCGPPTATPLSSPPSRPHCRR